MPWTSVLAEFLAGDDMDPVKLKNWHDLLEALTDPWTDYSPTFAWNAPTPPSLGNGTLIAEYVQVGHLAIARWMITAGTTTSFGSGAYSFGLPVTSAEPTGAYMGGATLFDSSAGVARNIHGLFQNSNMSVGQALESGARVSATTPVTLAVGDQLGGLVLFETS